MTMSSSNSTQQSIVSTGGKLISTSQQIPPPPQQQQQQNWRPPGQEIALPLHVQSLERALDVSGFINQLDKLLATPLEATAAATFADCGVTVEKSQGASGSKSSSLTTKGIWQDEQARKRDLSCLYNFGTLAKRKWLKNVLLEDSDSDSDSEQVITERDLKILLKIHKYRRKYQKRYHTDILNSQYTYFGAGLLSEHDRFPEHQKFILEEYGFTIPSVPPSTNQSQSVVTVAAASPPKRTPVKRRRSTHRSLSNASDAHGKLVSMSSVGSDIISIDPRTGYPSSSSDLNSPMSSPSPFASFVVPMTKLPTASNASATFVDNRPIISVSTTVPSLARPVPEPASGDLSPEALRWRAWKAIALEDVPKAHTERLIQRKYHSVVLKQMAVYCGQFLEQAREIATSGKKAGSRHGKKFHGGNQIICLRPISKQLQQHQQQQPGTSKKD